MAEKSTSGRVVRHLSIAYFEPALSADGQKTVLVRTARRGDVVDPAKLANGELERLEDLRAFLPEGARPEHADEERQAVLDLYRGQRGDTEAMQRAMERAASGDGPSRLQDATGGIVDVSGQSAADPAGEGNVGRLADHISASKLTVDDTVALAQDDPERARRVLEAERLASGGSPRAGVEQGLQKIIDDGGA